MLIENIPLLITAALQLLTGLAQGLVAALPVLIEALPEIITAIINALVEGIDIVILDLVKAGLPEYHVMLLKGCKRFVKSK
jgi:hypothetical protein